MNVLINKSLNRYPSKILKNAQIKRQTPNNDDKNFFCREIKLRGNNIKHM